MHKMMLDLPDQIETDRLLLRPYRPGDGLAYFTMSQRNREHLHPFEADNPAAALMSAEAAEILMREFYAGWVAREVFFLGGWEKLSGDFAAQIYIGVMNWTLPEFEVGYFVDVDHQGRGFVTEGVTAALDFIFTYLRAQRVILRCNDTNTRSWKVAERCGFVREGHLRQTKPHLTREDGTPSGDYLYAMLREEYAARQPSQ